MISNAVDAASAEMSWKAIDRYSKDYVEMQEKQGVKFYKTPDTVLQKQLESTIPPPPRRSGENPLFKEDRGLAEGVRGSRGEVGLRHLRQPAHGLQPLLRRQARAAPAKKS